MSAATAVRIHETGGGRCYPGSRVSSVCTGRAIHDDMSQNPPWACHAMQGKHTGAPQAAARMAQRRAFPAPTTERPTTRIGLIKLSPCRTRVQDPVRFPAAVSLRFSSWIARRWLIYRAAKPITGGKSCWACAATSQFNLPFSDGPVKCGVHSRSVVPLFSTLFATALLAVINVRKSGCGGSVRSARGPAGCRVTLQRLIRIAASVPRGDARALAWICCAASSLPAPWLHQLPVADA